MKDEKLILENGATPLTVAEVVVRECGDEDWLEDVIYYLRAYLNRTYKGRLVGDDNADSD